MKRQKLTKNKEEYLRAIFHISEETKKDVRCIELARYLEVSKASVSEMLKELYKFGLVKYKKNKKVKLTKTGERIASRITNKHRIIENFLIEVLDKKKSEVHIEADRLEHAFFDTSISKIRKLLKNPRLLLLGYFQILPPKCYRFLIRFCLS